MPIASYPGNQLFGGVLSSDEMHSIADEFDKNAEWTVQVNASSETQEVADCATASYDVDGHGLRIHFHH